MRLQVELHHGQGGARSGAGYEPSESSGAGVRVQPYTDLQSPSTLAVELLGGWSQEAALQISRIGRLVGPRLGTTPAETVSHLFQRLSICLWRGNATMWARRLPSHSAWSDGNI